MFNILLIKTFYQKNIKNVLYRRKLYTERTILLKYLKI